MTGRAMATEAERGHHRTGSGMLGVRVEVVRGGRVESVHHVDAAVRTPDDGELVRAGAPDESVFTRSAIKPLQALPLVEDGVVERFGLTAEQLAVCCASHSGEPRHVDVVQSILDRIGVDAESLACGPHEPLGTDAARSLRSAGGGPDRRHNNCSGKHAGMLALALAHGWPTADYHREGHPVQERVREVLEQWTGRNGSELAMAVDGCGVVTFAFPLTALAGAYARLARAAQEPGSAAARVLGSMAAYPEMVAGSGRLCTRLLEVTAGRIVAKVGAEGVYAAAVLDRPLGIAVKVRDGARRASEVGLLALLTELGLLAPGEREALGRWARPA
ncbi:MAG: asparaginase, partial [Gammaproteobacteria bacterium]|nr:asparaginase [Gemmatimonadota bacterium]NIU74658.1 asparaginase [Gammaproteobacteria bacterium]